jgi:hypothetical protein
MQNLIGVEKRVRDTIRARADELMGSDGKELAQRIAGDVAAQVYHYLVAVAQYELAVITASRKAKA